MFPCLKGLLLNKFPYASLNIQHRMRPEIANLVRPHIYRDLEDHDSVQSYEQVKGIQKNLFFIQHQYKEEHDDNLLSFSNEYEAQFLVSTCKYLLLQGFIPTQITILTTYTGQLLYLRSLMPKHTFNGVTIQTVDNYQGEENDIVLLSLVRSNEEGDIGFLREENRVCVSISRAKKGFYCIGNFSLLAENSPLWKTILDNLERNDQVGQYLPLCCANHPETVVKARTPKDFETFAPEGGCQLACQFRLQCGHVCTRRCHTLGADHVNYKCKKICVNKCPNGHTCPKLCYQSCGECIVKVTRTLPKCGDQKEMLCYQNPSDTLCELPCKTTCPQGHVCPLKCYQECKKCELLTPKCIPKCQHTQMVPCYQDPTTFKCKEKCLHSCQNGHNCPLQCYQECTMCKILIAKLIPKCQHVQMVPCYQDPSTFKCMEKCTHLCQNGHNCYLKCYQECKCEVLIPKIIPKCQHIQMVPCYQDPTTFKCKDECSHSCQYGHPCPKRCGESCGQCSTVVEKLIPECSHKVMLPCSVDPVQKNCTMPCERELQCGHKCQAKCGEMCKRFCEVKIIRELSCKHCVEIPCYRNRLLTNVGYSISSRCKEQCETILPCGHQCQNLCYQPCTKMCEIIVDKIRPCGHTEKRKCYQPVYSEKSLCMRKCERRLQCGHHCTSKCGKPCNCRVSIQITLPCGHSCTTSCKESETVVCKVKTKKILPCGHSISSSCGEQNPVCHVKVLKQLPCRHKKKVACHEDPRLSSFKCEVFCKSELACGHRCSGVCGECSQKRFHQPCKYGFDLERFCGHRGSVQCVDMSDIHPGKKKKHLANCIHQNCSHDCSTPCPPCEEPCPWGLPSLFLH